MSRFTAPSNGSWHWPASGYSAMNVALQRLRSEALTATAPRSLRLPSVLRLQWLGLLGPAFAVSIGYIDPGNWATDLAAGAYGFRLLWVVVFANLLAIALQIAVVRLALLTGEDLASAVARRWPRAVPYLWSIFQGSAIATDLAEFTGIVLGLQLLFHWSMTQSVASGLVVVGLVLASSRDRSKVLEALLVTIVGFIALVFVYQVATLHPAPALIGAGLAPSIPDASALVVIVGIIGATVMPHNLFLHSSLVLKNAPRTDAARSRCSSFFVNETVVALNVATLINGAILIVGAALRGSNDSIPHAFAALAVLTGGVGAVLFGAALLITGIAASATATLSGDYIFAGFCSRPVNPLFRRVLTLAPAALLLLAGVSAVALLIWSQVALALILPAALLPLMFEYHRALARSGRPWRRAGYLFAWAATVCCIGFDVVLCVQSLPR